MVDFKYINFIKIKLLFKNSKLETEKFLNLIK